MVKTISAPLPVLDVAPAAQSAVLDAPIPTPPATSIPSVVVPQPEFYPPTGVIQKCELPPAVICQEVAPNVPVGPVTVPTTSNAAANDLGSAFVTVALSINITSNGIYATSRCSSPARAPNGSNAQGDPAVSTASVPLKLCLGETNTTGSRTAGGNSLPTSQPPTPQACPTMDTYLMDLQHKLASLSMANNSSNATSHVQQQPQQQSYSPEATQQLPSPSSSTKEGTPSLDHLNHPSVVVDQVDQAAESNRPAQQQQQRKVLPSTIDIHDLHSELSKLHSQGTGHPPALLKAKEPETKLNTITTEASAVPPPTTTNPVAQVTSSQTSDVVDDHPQTPTEQPQPSFKAIPVPVAQIPVVAPVTAPATAVPAISTTRTTTKEQKSSQTEPHLIVAQQPLQRKLSLPPPAPAGGRRISRFCVSLVDEQQRAATPNSGMLPEDANKDPEFRELLLRHDQEKKALIRKHEEELAAFHARRKQQQPTPQQQQPHPVPSLHRQEATESSRTPSPGARSSPDHSEGRGVPIPNSSSTATASGILHGPVNNATPGSSPGTPTRQTKTFTDDLLRLVQDLGSKPGIEKSKKAGGEGVEKAPTLNQLRAGANGGAVANLQQQQQQQQQHHSLTQTAGIFTPQT